MDDIRQRIRQAFDQRFVGAIIELLPLAPRAGRADQKPDIPGGEEIAKQDARLGKERLRAAIGCVGERDDRLSQRLERKVRTGRMIRKRFHLREMRGPAHGHSSRAAWNSTLQLFVVVANLCDAV
ncbi:hypothetical protein [Bradyrhizobium cenepequi]